ncbi:general odorant-binding protein 56a-like [Camponotus floridanus]|uniref:general odorant-binding protein 56a-like n=1 Tax=Camponotus floridanus TaxID=104421 RepID=UPI00059B723B|nr:general odorant-binding protein 56a-like [Camponotus floridanus]
MKKMATENLILICAFLIVTQLVIVHCNEANIDWTTVHDELRKLAGNLRKKCTGEIKGITDEMLEEAELGNFSEGDNKLACYFKCVMDKGGVMKKDGKINYKLLSKMMPAAYRHIGQEMLDECRNISGDDKCDVALNFNKCMYRANPVAYFVI